MEKAFLVQPAALMIDQRVICVVSQASCESQKAVLLLPNKSPKRAAKSAATRNISPSSIISERRSVSDIVPSKAAIRQIDSPNQKIKTSAAANEKPCDNSRVRRKVSA